VRVSEFACKVKLEGFFVLDKSISELEGPALTLNDDLLLEKGFNCGVHLLEDVLHDHWVSHSDSGFKDL